MKVLIKPANLFGTVNEIAVHMKPECTADIDNAFEMADRDLFPAIVFYVSSLSYNKYIRECTYIFNQATLEQ